MNIGEELRRLRESQGLSLRAVAKRTGISASTLSRIENDAIPPSPEDLKKFAEIYHVRYEILMKLAGYLEDDQTTPHRRLLADLEVTEEEAQELLSYLEYLRWRRCHKNSENTSA